IVEEVSRIAAAGATVGLLAANTIHVVFDAVRKQSRIPLISIVEATCEAARSRRLRRLGIFGTRYTMLGQFYPDVFAPCGIPIVAPNDAERVYIHAKYVGELLRGVFSDETRERLLAIASAMRDREQIDGLILGGTELPLILRGVEVDGVSFLDTTEIHVQSAVTALAS
ncbi:MAG: aspartate/glutamate racemase family protein, partial [Gammaproteobacteria bacterium]